MLRQITRITKHATFDFILLSFLYIKSKKSLGKPNWYSSIVFVINNNNIQQFLEKLTLK